MGHKADTIHALEPIMLLLTLGTSSCNAIVPHKQKHTHACAQKMTFDMRKPCMPASHVNC